MKQKKHRQKGMVLPFVLVFLLILCAMVLYAYNSAQMVQEKIRLTNTADASIHAGAVHTARMANYFAYANRAMIMNSIAMAYTTGLASWLTETKQAVTKMDEYSRNTEIYMRNQRFIDDIYPNFRRNSQGWRILNGSQGCRNEFSSNQNCYGAYMAMLNVAMNVHANASYQLGWTQGAFGDAVEPEGATYRDYGSVIRLIRKFNRMNYALDHKEYQYAATEGDLEARGGSQDEQNYYAKLPDTNRPDQDVLYDNNWQDTEFQKRAAGEPLDRMIEVTMEEFNGRKFLDNRNWTKTGVILRIPDPSDPFDTIDVPGIATKRGGTQLLGNQGLGWGSLDTLSGHWAILPELPFGGANAYANQEIKGIDNSFSGSRSTNPIAHRRAHRNNAPGFPMGTVGKGDGDGEYPIGAIPNYGQLGSNLLAEDDPAFVTVARNFRKMSATRTIAGTNSLNSNSIQPSGRLDIYEGNLEKNQDINYSSIASAETKFDRPFDRADGRHELANVFHPYWHAMLVNVSDAHLRKAQSAHNEENHLELFVE